MTTGMRIHSLAAVLLLTTAAGAARADEPTTVSVAPADTAAAGDPNLDRGFILPTAMTQPAGSITYNNYELLLHGVSYGITDRWQLSATVLAPIVREMPFVGFASLKGQIYRGERLHLALQGSLGGAASTGDSRDGIMMGGLGALASLCVRQDCSSLLSASATYQFFGGSSDTDGGLIYGVSLVHRVGRHVKLLGELASASVIDANEFGRDALLSYGVRFYGGSLASDIGFMKPLGTDIGFLMGIPFASVSYRWQ